MLARTVALSTLLAGCGGATFNITIDESADVVVEGNSIIEQLAGDFGFGEFVSMDLTEADELANQGVEPGDIRSVRLTSFTMAAIDPAGADLAFLESMELLVSAPDLPEILVASLADFPEGVSDVTFDLEDVDLTEYVVSESMTIGTAVTGRRPNEDTTVQAAFRLRVGVTGQGVLGQL